MENRQNFQTGCLLGNTRKQHPTVYRKPTHTDRLLDQTSYNPTSHKATTVRTLTRRAQIVCDSDDSLTDETKHLNTVFIKNNYNTDFIERITYIRPNDGSNNSYTSTATIPYVRSTSETIARILRPYNCLLYTSPSPRDGLLSRMPSSA